MLGEHYWDSGLRDASRPWQRMTLEGVKDELACGTYNVYFIQDELNGIVKIPRAWTERAVLYVGTKPCVTV